MEVKDLLGSWKCEGLGNSSNYGEGGKDLKDFTVEVKEFGNYILTESFDSTTDSFLIPNKDA